MSLEWNQNEAIVWDTEYTSWEGCIENGWNEDEDQYREFIQISAVRFDTKSYKVKEEFNEYVQPRINPQLSDYIKDLTGIKQGQVDEADDLKPVLEKFLKWSEGYNLYSWGDDHRVLEENIGLYNLDFNVDEDRFINLREKMDSEILVDEYNSGNLVERFGEEPEGQMHNARDDCENLVRALELLSKSDISEEIDLQK